MKLQKELNTLQKTMVQNMYKSFTKSCLNNNDSPSVIKMNLWQVNSTFQKFGMTDTFCSNTEKLGDHLFKKGNLKISNIVLNELGKICTKLGKDDTAQKVIEKSLEISRIMKDEIHVLARLNDLEFLYKRNNDTANLIKTLKRKVKCCHNILSDYELYSKNFNSISKEPTEKNAIKVQLAFTYNDLADALFDTKPHKAIELIKKAKKIYVDLGQNKEANYLRKKLSFLKRKTERISDINKHECKM